MLSKITVGLSICATLILMPISASAQISEIRVGIAQFDERILDIAFAAQAGDETSAALHAEILFDEPEFLKWAASGLVIHTGSNQFTLETLLDPNRRIIFGSRFLFRQQVALGVKINEDWATEVFFEHLSNAGLGFSNEGADSVGFRVARSL